MTRPDHPLEGSERRFFGGIVKSFRHYSFYAHTIEFHSMFGLHFTVFCLILNSIQYIVYTIQASGVFVLFYFCLKEALGRKFNNDWHHSFQKNITYFFKTLNYQQLVVTSFCPFSLVKTTAQLDMFHFNILLPF